MVPIVREPDLKPEVARCDDVNRETRLDALDVRELPEVEPGRSPSDDGS